MNKKMHNMDTPLAKDWDNYWSLDQTQRFTKVSWSKKRIMTILDDHIQKGKKVLDAGCGSGFFSGYFCQKEMDVVSLDYSDDALKIASKLTSGRSHLVKADLVSDNIELLLKDKFDVIFSDGLMEHFSEEDQNKIFQNLISVLSDDGVLVTFVPNRWSPWELIRPFYMPGIEEDPFVLRDLRQLNHHHGLNIVRDGGINTLPIKFSPDKLVGHLFGMLLYTIAKK